MPKAAAKRKALAPGDHIRTPWGLAWVNVMPPDVRAAAGEVFIRLGDGSTRRVEAHGLELVDF